MIYNKDVLVDTNALIFLTGSDKNKIDIIERKIYDIKKSQKLFYNLIIFKEFSVGIESPEVVREWLFKYSLNRITENESIMTLAAGATAEYYGLAIMTNNLDDFRKYFPNVELIEI